MELTQRSQALPDKLPSAFDIRVRANRSKSDFAFESVASDKSISQRAILLNALADGRGTVRNVLRSRDIDSCLSALERLGVGFQRQGNDLVIDGVGLRGLKRPAGTLDIGNTATSARMILSVLAGYPYEVEITGNSLLSRRPMDWVAAPLTRMGARIDYLEKHGCLPLKLQGSYPLSPIHVDAAVASAQEKSSVLFAGLFADGVTRYRQLCQSRDHTERMMKYFGIPIETKGNVTSVAGGLSFEAKEVVVPGDISSASYLVAAYVLRSREPRGGLTLQGVGVNPTRLGFLHALRNMGVDLALRNERMLMSEEPVADIHCMPPGKLSATRAEGDSYIQSMIDEIPLLAAVAALADGVTVITNCEELKDKDTNRIETTARALTEFGADVRYGRDSLTIYGGKPIVPAVVDSFGDHRIAMTAAVLASSLDEPSVIRNCGCISVSYPGFLRDLSQFADVEILSSESEELGEE